MSRVVNQGSPLDFTDTPKERGAWPANTPFDCWDFTDVEFQFSTGTVSVTRSLDGLNYKPWPVSDKNGKTTATAATPDIYSVDGRAFLKFSAPVTVSVGA